jgi:hypothetical protein
LKLILHSAVAWLTFLLLVASSLRDAAASSEPPYHLKLLAPASYLPGIPFLARVELLRTDESRAQEIWDAEAMLNTPTAGVVLSTNRLRLRNGLGSTLVMVTNGVDFDLIATLEGWQARRTLVTKTNAPITAVSGVLTETNAIWSGIVNVTADVTVPAQCTLTIQPDTLVLINGASSNPNGKDIEVRGRVLALGTADQPICFTASTNGLNWGEIRHVNSAPSLYQWCTFNRAGRAVGGGHTGTAPTLRTTNSRITFESCNFTDNTLATSGTTIGKVMEGSGSDFVMNNCLWARARMGPEINGSALLLTNSYIMDMLGPDDCDGIYLHNQQSGQTITIVDTVIAQGDDDGIDTLGSDITVQNCIIRDWKNLNEDSKGISVYGGAVRVVHCLLVDNKCGISGKDEHSVRIHMDRSTIVSTDEYALGILNKTGSMFPTNVDVHVTNSILRTLNPQANSLFTSYQPKDLRVYYSNIGEPWTGATNCTVADPSFQNETGHDYQLMPGSPCIDTGDPARPADPDGSRIDQGFFTFCPPPPVLGSPRTLPLGGLQILVSAYTNRNYQLESSVNFLAWKPLGTFFQANTTTPFTDLTATNAASRFYRVKWGL